MNADKRARMTGRRSGKGRAFFRLWHDIIFTEQFAAIKGSALKLLVDLASQYNGHNNGELCPAALRGRWKSERQMSLAIKQLEQSGWIKKTKQGGMGIGSSLYGITWWGINPSKKHDHPPDIATNDWAKNSPHPKRVREAP